LSLEERRDRGQRGTPCSLLARGGIQFRSLTLALGCGKLVLLSMANGAYPVTIATLPVRSGMSEALKCGAMTVRFDGMAWWMALRWLLGGYKCCHMLPFHRAVRHESISMLVKASKSGHPISRRNPHQTRNYQSATH